MQSSGLHAASTTASPCDSVCCACSCWDAGSTAQIITLESCMDNEIQRSTTNITRLQTASHLAYGVIAHPVCDYVGHRTFASKHTSAMAISCTQCSRQESWTQHPLVSSSACVHSSNMEWNAETGGPSEHEHEHELGGGGVLVKHKLCTLRRVWLLSPS